MIYVALLWILLLPLGSCGCSSKVVSAPIQNVTVLDPNLRRGLALSVGTPAQDLAFGLAGYANNTFLFSDFDSCGVPVPAAEGCIIGRGGIFLSNESSSWSEVTSSSWLEASSASHAALDTPSPTFNFSAKTWGDDTLHVNSTVGLENLPFGITTQGLTINSIGLGSNSTFLSALDSSGLISSRTWSIFYGLTGADSEAQLDGSVVFGGYDQAKVTGENLTLPIKRDSNCRTGLVATVKSVDMGFENGTTQNIQASPTLMCLDPSFAIVTFASGILDKFRRKAGGTFRDLSIGRGVNGLVFDAQDVYSGNLSVTFDSGLSITIPNNQLVVPNYVVVANETEFDDDTREVLVGSPKGADPADITYLGQPFFTAAYVMVNPESFTVWGNKITSEEDFIGVDASGAKCEDDVARPKTTATPKQTASSTPSLSPSSSSGISKGAIAGIAIAAVAGLSMIIAIWYYFRKRRGRHSTQAQDPASVPPHNDVAEAPAGDSPPWLKSQLPSSSLQELPTASHDSAYELPAQRF